MSLLGKKPIAIPGNVKVVITGRTVAVSSGEKKLEFTHRPEVGVAWNADEKHVVVSIAAASVDDPAAGAYWGTTRALIQNMVDGVTKGFQKELEVNGVGYTATITPKGLDLKLGFANIITVPIPKGVEVVVDKNILRIKGSDRQAVGQFAAVVRSKRKPEPYNGKGIKYTTETLRRKQGKAFGS